MKHAAHYLVVLMLPLLQEVQAQAQVPAKPVPETKIVVRISREFIYELTGKDFRRDAPIDKNAFGAKVEGSAHVDGKFDVKLQKSANASDFYLLINGEVLTQAVATTRPVQVHTHGVAVFAGRRRIVFDGDAFTGEAIDMNVTYHSSIDQLCFCRGGMVGVLTRGIARTTVRRNLSEADVQAGNEIRTQLTTSIEKESDQLLVTMNKVGPLLKKGEEILRDEKMLSVTSVQLYLAATDQHLYMSIGPPDQRIPTLPNLELAKRGPIEMWIATEKSSRKDLLNPVLEHWKYVKPFVIQRINRQSPELGKIVEQVQVESVDGWYVVTFAPKLLELP